MDMEQLSGFYPALIHPVIDLFSLKGKKGLEYGDLASSHHAADSALIVNDTSLRSIAPSDGTILTVNTSSELPV